MFAVVATIIVGALMAGAGIFAAIMSNREDAKSASKH